jgi:hypothetical protein
MSESIDTSSSWRAVEAEASEVTYFLPMLKRQCLESGQDMIHIRDKRQVSDHQTRLTIQVSLKNLYHFHSEYKTDFHIHLTSSILYFLSSSQLLLISSSDFETLLSTLNQ